MAEASALVRFRDAFRSYIPPWLSERLQTGRNRGFSLLWSMIAPLDAAADVLLQGMRAAWPGKGTSTALPYIGRTRGLIRNQNETDAEYAERLRGWLDEWREAGSQLQIAKVVHEYLRTRPKVRIVNRAGKWITVDTDGTVTTHQATFDWDSVSHPERAGYWSDLWLVVYSAPTQWGTSGPFLDTAGAPTWGADQLGIGHDDTREEYDALTGLLAQWKAAHSLIRAVIFTSDATLFDPTTPASLPNGQWGEWGNHNSGSRVASSRNLTTCRYWEPR